MEDRKKRPHRILICLSDQELALLDKARGEMGGFARGTYARVVLLQALKPLQGRDAT